MKKCPWICLLLALVVLLPACAFARTAKPVQPDKPFPPVQSGPTATQVVKVVTLAPRGDAPEPVQPTAVPTGRAIDEQAANTITANWRALIGDPTLELAFKALERSPNAASYPAVLFVDPLGNSYYASQATLQPIEFTQERPVRDQPGSPKTAEQLRAQAEELARTHSKRFAELKGQLVYSEGNKGENNFFRWEMPGTDVGGMPAILQFGFKQDGSLFSYLNSLDLLP